ncbi:MAG TPA: hypothetical protein VIO58_15975 [Candidatus Methanoperedens sp.]
MQARAGKRAYICGAFLKFNEQRYIHVSYKALGEIINPLDSIDVQEFKRESMGKAKQHIKNEYIDDENMNKFCEGRAPRFF